jgi:hypothetical protein
MKRDKSINALIGFRSPQIQIQITPLQWGIGGCIGTSRIGLHLGPVAVVLWFRFGDWEMDKWRVRTR